MPPAGEGTTESRLPSCLLQARLWSRLARRSPSGTSAGGAASVACWTLPAPGRVRRFPVRQHALAHVCCERPVSRVPAFAVGGPQPLDCTQATNTYGAHAAGRLLAGGVGGWLRPNPARSACPLLAGAAHPGARPHRLCVPLLLLSRTLTTKQRWAGLWRRQTPTLLCADWAVHWHASEREALTL